MVSDGRVKASSLGSGFYLRFGPSLALKTWAQAGLGLSFRLMGNSKIFLFQCERDQTEKQSE